MVHLPILFSKDEDNVPLEPPCQLLEKIAIEVQSSIYHLRRRRNDRKKNQHGNQSRISRKEKKNPQKKKSPREWKGLTKPHTRA